MDGIEDWITDQGYGSSAIDYPRHDQIPSGLQDALHLEQCEIFNREAPDDTNSDDCIELSAGNGKA